MNKWIEMKKKHLLIISVLISLSLVFIGYQIYEHRREEARMTEEQKAIEEAYRWLHYAIGGLEYIESAGWLVDSSVLERMSVYQPLDNFPSWKNEHGLFVRTYLILRMYYHRTGVYLAYEKLLDYFSEEFEPDRTLRLYNNGNHPEIEAFVDWMREGLRAGRFGEINEYEDNLNHLRNNYLSEHSDEHFTLPGIRQMSPRMLDALARAEANPDYELDLTSLQEAGY